jgi:hypothetical protein
MASSSFRRCNILDAGRCPTSATIVIIPWSPRKTRPDPVWHDVRTCCDTMSAVPLVRRVELLEQRVDALSELPARVTAVEAQIIALREDLATLRVELRGEIGTLRNDFETFRGQAALRVELHAVRDELRAEIRAGDEETRREMRVLHEDVISRIALLQEGITRANGRNNSPAAQRRPRRRR